MAYTYAFNPFTRKLDIVSTTVVDTTPGGVNDVLLFEDATGLLLEDGTYLIL
jgi:hypothetical protein